MQRYYTLALNHTHCSSHL